LPEDTVRSLAEGRVWTGAEAVRNGLADEIGGLDRAAEIAAEAAGLEDGTWRLRWYPRKQTFIEMLTGALGSGGAVLVESLGLRGAFAKALSPLEKKSAADDLKSLIESRGTVQTRMPFSVTIN
jgi:protease-4